MSTQIIEFNRIRGTLKQNKNTINIDPIIVKLLECFLQNPDVILNRQQIAEQVWHTEHISDDAINRSISILRKALSDERDLFIKTIPRKGYIFSVPAGYTINQKEHVSKINESDEQLPPRDKINNHLAAGFAVVFILTFAIAIFLIGKILSPDQQQIEDNRAIVLVNTLNFDIPQQTQIIEALLPVANFQFKSNPNVTKPLANSDWQQLAHQNIDFVLELTNHKNTQHQQFQIQLVEVKTRKHIVARRLSYDASTAAFIDFKQQLPALFRLKAQSDSKTLSKLLSEQQLNYTEIEQILVALKQVNQRTAQIILKQLTVLNQLHKKHPTNVTTLELLVRYYAKTPTQTLQNGDVNDKNLKKLIDKLLAIEPTNFWGLEALYYYHMRYVGLHEKAITIVNQLTNNYPNETKTWRIRIHWLIRKSAPCVEIRREVNAIPEGVFTSYRLEVINNILDICQTNASSNELYENYQQKSDKNKQKALYNNLFFFVTRNDYVLEMLEGKWNKNPILLTAAYIYQIKAMLGVKNPPLSLAANQYSKPNKYMQAYTTALTYLYSNQQSELKVFNLSPALTISHYHTVTISSALIKHAQQTGDNSLLHSFVEKWPPFNVSIRNKSNLLVYIAALYHIGQTQQAAQIAQQFYNQLEAYRNRYPNDYHYWALGRYQLAALLYCQNICQAAATPAITPQSLNHFFAENHTWWLDDLGVMSVILKPWQDNPTVATYLNKIKQDSSRVRVKLGY